MHVVNPTWTIEYMVIPFSHKSKWRRSQTFNAVATKSNQIGLPPGAETKPLQTISPKKEKSN